MRRHSFFAAVLGIGIAAAHAGTVDVTVVDRNGRPARDAIVSLVPQDGKTVASHLPEHTIIDQRHETFLPLDVIVRAGGHVVFTNNDTTKHQVYSFSPIKQFQFVISQGEVSPPIVFPTAGIAAIGCNIHDQMIAYVFVGDMPYAAVADASGHAVFDDVTPGQYRLAAWHPQMGPQFAPAGQTITVGTTGLQSKSVLPLMIEPPRAMKPMHMDY